MSKIKRYYEKSNGGKIEHPDGPICYYKDVAKHLERSDNSGYSKLPLGYEASADRLAREVSKLVRDGVIGSRSPAADALLEYKDGNFA